MSARKLAACPTCGSTSTKCLRPSGHSATEWHVEREDAQARLCRCVICLAWLTKRNQPLELPA